MFRDFVVPLSCIKIARRLIPQDILIKGLHLVVRRGWYVDTLLDIQTKDRFGLLIILRLLVLRLDGGSQ